MTTETLVHRPKWSRKKKVRCLVWLVIAGTLLGLTAVGGWWVFVRPSDKLLLRQARLSLARRDFQRCGQLADIVLARSPDSHPALLLAARSANHLGQYLPALSYYDRISDDGGKMSIIALSESGDLLLSNLHRAAAAELRFRKVLLYDSDNIHALNRLGYLCTTEGRGQETVQLLMRQIRLGQFKIVHLVVVGERKGFLNTPSYVDAFLRAEPDFYLPLIARARMAISENRNREAARLLRTVLTHAPDQVETWALLGHAIYELGVDKAFLNWQRKLPTAAEEHPMVWLVRGLWFRRIGKIQRAIRCFAESVRLDPDQIASNLQLGQALIAASHPKRAAAFLRRSTALSEVSGLLGHIIVNQQDVQTMHRLSEQMESLGRLWEAWAWCRIALQVNPRLGWARDRSSRLRPRLQVGTPWTLPSNLPGRDIDWSEFPLPNWDGIASVTGGNSDAPLSDCNVRFSDDASVVGLRFQYEAGHQQGSPDKPMFESLGGGVAVLDYDNDGRPDIYLTQGCRWPPNPRQTEFLDRLYRNPGNGGLEDVTLNAGLLEGRFSQGVTVGDYDGDGFSDLYVANIGGNRFYRNNGDGTFSDVTTQTGTGGQLWTSSCVLADLNGDARPDLYCVNYLGGKNALVQVCTDNSGHIRICSPLIFPAAQDRVYLNTGDGEFQDVTLTSGIVTANGRGLGIVAADFDMSGRLSLFVANDESANFFFRNRVSGPGAALSFEERGLLTGLASDQDGTMTAGMGIAAGDANGDGRLDLFLTNFADESNTLYLQTKDGLFDDATRETGLRNGSFRTLGFGTQFIDGELDGRPDLILTNGHVDNVTDRRQAYRMRPQYYHNIGTGRFAEVASKQLGPFFEGTYLGRGLARLDWNRDGREDIVISHLDSPVALLTNRTPHTGHVLAIRLVGIISSRDAIGTTVRVTAGNRAWTRQLTAGDGFQASNQRMLVFGLAAAGRIDRIRILWPSGIEQTLADVPVDRELILIEGRPKPVIRRLADRSPRSE